jgi:hypothetical protein
MDSPEKEKKRNWVVHKAKQHNYQQLDISYEVTDSQILFLNLAKARPNYILML